MAVFRHRRLRSVASCFACDDRVPVIAAGVDRDEIDECVSVGTGAVVVELESRNRCCCRTGQEIPPPSVSPGAAALSASQAECASGGGVSGLSVLRRSLTNPVAGIADGGRLDFTLLYVRFRDARSAPIRR
jgi:hypothetical protein